MSGVLDGIRVLDFGRYIAGPYCATLLGDLGAEVIRIEKVDGSEDRYLAPVGADGDGALFMQMGRNKLGMTLNPMKPEGREVVRRLVETADVVVANLPPATIEAMGLDYESLRSVRPDIILVNQSAFGSGGPYSDRVGFDAVGQAMSGAMYLSGWGEAPMKSYVSYVDFGTAMLSAFGTLAAIIERQRTGRGQRVEASLFATALTIANYPLIEQGVRELNRVATGNRGQVAAPADAFATTDGWIVVHVVGQPLFERWVRLMGEDHWLKDPRFASDEARGEHGEIISERMAAWCSTCTTDEALAALAAARIPSGPVLSPQQALDDPHVAAKGYFKLVDYPGLPKPAPVMETPVTLSETPGSIRHRAPTLGEHTDGILSELGYSEAEIAELREKRVV